MRGLLFYDAVGAERNRWFIGRLIESANEHGCDLELVIAPDGTDDALKSSFDFAIVRTIDPSLNRRLEEMSIPTFNNAKTSLIANDKWKTYLFARELGLDVMPTEKIEAVAPMLPFPYVIKTVDGHGGSEVFMARDADEYEKISTALAGKVKIAQCVCSEPGIDMRVYTLGGEILAAVRRTSNTDFRSNFSLGGNAELTEPDDTVINAVRLIYSKLGYDLVGIDFIRHGGKWILNEIEDVVGTRMLYSLTDIDAASVYIDYIIKKLRHN